MATADIYRRRCTTTRRGPFEVVVLRLWWLLLAKMLRKKMSSSSIGGGKLAKKAMKSRPKLVDKAAGKRKIFAWCSACSVARLWCCRAHSGLQLLLPLFVSLLFVWFRSLTKLHQ